MGILKLDQFGPEFRYVQGKTHNSPNGHKKGAAYNNAGDEFGIQQAVSAGLHLSIKSTNNDKKLHKTPAASNRTTGGGRFLILGAIDHANAALGWPRLGLVLVGALVALQYVTLAKFAVLPRGAGFVRWGKFWQRVAAG